MPSNPSPTLSITLDIPLQRIWDLLCCALEYGSNYWAAIERYVTPRKLWREPTAKEPVYRHLDYPLSPLGALIIRDKENDKSPELILTLDKIHTGIHLMAQKYPQHFATFMSANEDAETGDVFLQLCLFEDLLYG
jgi:hypothetical protein